MKKIAFTLEYVKLKNFHTIFMQESYLKFGGRNGRWSKLGSFSANN